MALKMGSIEVPPSIIEKTGYIELEKHCDKPGHEKFSMMLLNNKVICPKCWVENKDKQIQVEQMEKHLLNSTKDKKDYLKRFSIVHNKSTLDKGLKDYINKTNTESEIKKQASEVTRKIIENQRNVFLFGPAGTGKSHIAMGILTNINAISNERRCLFVSVPKLYELIRKSYNSQYVDTLTEDDYLTRLNKADVLVLDDIGAELSMNTNKQASDFVTRILYSVLNAREGKSTIVTSNHSIEQLGFILDERIISRIKTDVVYIDFGKVSDKREIVSTLKS